MKSILLSVIVALSASTVFAKTSAWDLNAQREAYAHGSGLGRCVEGTQAFFSEAREGLDGYITVARTCVNGRYYPKAAPAEIRPCAEGGRMFVMESNDFNDSKRTVSYTCVNGRYVRN